jgi:hypothetical protein
MNTKTNSKSAKYLPAWEVAQVLKWGWTLLAFPWGWSFCGGVQQMTITCRMTAGAAYTTGMTVFALLEKALAPIKATAQLRFFPLGTCSI